MEGSVLESFFIQIGVDADDLRAGEKAITAAVLGIQKELQSLVGMFDDSNKKVSEGQKKINSSSDKMNKNLQEGAKKTREVFGSLKNELLAFTGITLSIGGAAKFITNMTSGVMGLSIQSKALGMSAKELDGWQRSAIAAGSTANEMTSSLQRVQDAITGIRNGDGSSPLLPIINGMMGLKVDWFDEKHTTTSSVEKMVMQRFRTLNPDQQKYAGQIMGWSPAIQQGTASGQIPNDQAKYEKLSNQTEATQNKARALNVALTDLDSRFSAVKLNIYSDLLPAANQFVTWLNGLADWFQKHPKEIKAALDAFEQAIETLVKWANTGATAVGGWKNAIELLVGLKVAAWVIEFTGAIKALMALQGLTAAAGSGVSGAAAGVLGKAGIAGAAAYLSEPYIDKALQYLFGDNKSFEKIRTAQTFSDFGSAIMAALKSGFSEDNLKQIRQSGSGLGNPYQYTPSGSPEPHPLQHAQAAKATGAGKLLLDFMSGTFGNLEAKYKLPTGLLRSVATTESHGDQFAQSPAGAKGLFQFMDGTAKDFGLTGGDVFDPQKSAQAAAKYLSELLKHYHGKLEYALAAYNWGEGNVDKYGLSAMPGETSAYVPKVIAGLPQTGASMAYQRYQNHVITNNHRYENSGGATTENHIGQIVINSPATSFSKLQSDIQSGISNKTIGLSGAR